MVYILHIDTSGDIGIVALGRDGILIASSTNEDTRNHAAVINNMINEVLQECGITTKELNGVAVCAGPGSYTGLRIGMATAKGLCYVLDIPLFLDNKLTLLAHQAHDSKKNEMYDIYMTVLVARDQEYFIALYDENLKCITAPKHVSEDEISAQQLTGEKMLVSGEISPSLHNWLKNNNIEINEEKNIDIRQWITYSIDQYKCNNNVNLSTAEPFYLKQVYTHKKL